MNHKFEVPVTEKWFKNEGTVSFILWANANNIQEGDWDFRTLSGILYPTFLFRYEEDALAFRLRFDL